MNIEPSMGRLLTDACPSIQYRIRRELLHQPESMPEMLALQEQILQDGAVREVLSERQPDGWLAWSFHGYNSMESGIRLLREKGVEPSQPVMASAVCALESATDRLERGLGSVGKILDDLGFGGSRTIQAYLLAHAGACEHPLVRAEIDRALDVFGSVIGIGSGKDLYEKYKTGFVFRPGLRWPSIYHLRLLAFTACWRTPENTQMLIKSIRRMLQLMPLPDTHVRHKSQLIASASFCMFDFGPDMNQLTDAGWMPWFHRMELFARLGILDQIPALNEQARTLAHMLIMGEGMFLKKLQHPYFNKWGSYTGLMLEQDWRLPQRRINDLTFRSLLILRLSDTSFSFPNK